MRNRVIIPCFLAIVATVVCLWWRYSTPQKVMTDILPAQAEVSAPTNDSLPSQVTEVAKTGNYRLIVGANPSLGVPVFSPPTNSVEITNELQLQLLIEQSRPKQTNQQQ